MKRLVFILSLIVAAVVAPAWAQAPRGFYPWWDSPVARDLNLSPDQTRQIQDTVREYRIKLIDLRANVEKAEARLEDLFNEPNLDPRRANEEIDNLANARAELTRAFSQMSLRLRGVLTREQWQELQKRQPRRMRPGPPGSPEPMKQRRQGPPPDAQQQQE